VGVGVLVLAGAEGAIALGYLVSLPKAEYTTVEPPCLRIYAW